MEVRKTPLWDGDGFGGQACVAVDLAPLEGQAPTGPGSDVTGKSTPYKRGLNKVTGGKPEFLNFRGTIGRKVL